MSNKIITLSDGIVVPDHLSINKPQNQGFDTDIMITARNGHYDGELIVEHVKNKTVLGGRSTLLERSFGIKPNIAQHIFINDNVLGEFNSETGEALTTGITYAHNSPQSIMPRQDMKLWSKRTIDYWCAGDGAINRSIPSQSHTAHITDTKLFHMIPFRFIKSDQTLPDEIRRLYKMEVVFGSNSKYYGYKAYYFKKLVKEKVANSDIGINMTVDKQPYTPKWSDTVTDLENNAYDTSFKGNKTQKSYIDMTMNVLSEEFKEWFEFTDKTLGNATISEIGLIIGLDGIIQNNNTLQAMEDIASSSSDFDTQAMKSEIYDAELFSHLTFDSYPVSRDNSSIQFNYRVYA